MFRARGKGTFGIRLILLLLLAVVVIAVASMLRLPFSDIRDPTSVWVLAVIGLVLIVLQWIVYFQTSTVKQEISGAQPIQYSYAKKDIDRLFNRGDGLLGVGAAEKFLQAFLFPQQVFERISEHIEPFHRSTWVRTTYTISLAGRSTGEVNGTDFIIPLHEPPRGRLLDGVRISGAGEKRTSSLSSREQITFMTAVLRRLMWAACKPNTTQAYDVYIKEVEPKVLRVLSSAEPPATALLDEIVKSIRDLPQQKGPKQTNVAVSMLQKLADVNPLCVAVPATDVLEAAWPNLHRFVLERRMLPILEQAPGAKQPNWPIRLADDLRLLLDATINRVSYNLSASTRTNSYHAEIEGPEGSYLAADELLPVLDERVSSDSQPEKKMNQLRAQVTPRLGQRRSHIYISRNDNIPVSVATQFFERAPGSLSTAFIASLATAVMVILLGFYQVALTQKNPPTPESWLLPALLAVPLAVATLSGLDTTRGSRHRSLLSHGINGAVIVLALSAFAAASEPKYFQAWAPTIWWVLSLCGVALCISTFIAWIMRVSLERHFVKGKDR